MPGQLVVVKFGGELLETPERLAEVTTGLAALAAEGPLVVVHGGGREIDAELQRRGIAKQAVDGLRITDAPTLDAVIAVLAGTINTRLVAALVTHRALVLATVGSDTIGVVETGIAHRVVQRAGAVLTGAAGERVSKAAHETAGATVERIGRDQHILIHGPVAVVVA